MAFKLTVDFNKLALVVETDATEPTTTFIYAQSSVTYEHAQALSAYTLMSFSDVFVDPDTKNLYFTAQFDSPNALSVTMAADISTINVHKVLADSSVLEELASKFEVTVDYLMMEFLIDETETEEESNNELGE